MAFVARAPRTAAFGAATTPQEVADAACDALSLQYAAVRHACPNAPILAIASVLAKFAVSRA